MTQNPGSEWLTKAFSRFARTSSWVLGHPVAFILAVLVILGWAVCGPIVGFSNAWQLVINSFTSVVTFMMVFLIQNTQDRQGAAMQIKLNELLRAIEGAHTALVDLENASDEDLERLRQRYAMLAKITREKALRGDRDTGTPEVATGLTDDSASRRRPTAGGG